MITFPTHFSDTQKEELATAAVAGRLEILQIIHGAVAAILVYAARQTREEQSVEKNIW